jgi:long-chain acyl-CoA synthetase
MDGEAAGAQPFSQLMKAADRSFDFGASWRAVKPDDVAVLIYTSGTTGAPKAVEISHGNVLAEMQMSRQTYPQLARTGRYMSYLPMAHLADRCVALYPSMSTGSSVTCFTDAKTAMASLPEVRPTFAATVPRMWEKLKIGLEAQFSHEPDETKRTAIHDAIEAATRMARLKSVGQPVPTDRRRGRLRLLAHGCVSDPRPLRAWVASVMV